MKSEHKRVSRLADLIRQQLHEMAGRRLASTTGRARHVLSRLEQFQGMDRLLTLCQRRRLPGAARRMRERLRQAAVELADDLADLQRDLSSQPSPPPDPPSLSAIVQDLEQIRAEFGGWEVKCPAGRQVRSLPGAGAGAGDVLLCARTDAIELQGVYLGEFDIQLRLTDLGAAGRHAPYQVVALDPHPASANEAVTHPHVSDHRLCEGSAGDAIRAALCQGRLCDFFLLVRSVLHTYNPESPHVRLSQWQGEACDDCGQAMGSEDVHCCEGCQENYCEECITCCGCCDRHMCGNCLRACRHCETSVCPACLKPCPRCGRRCCQSCLQEDLCPDCVENQEQEPSHEVQPPPTVAAGGHNPDSQASDATPDGPAARRIDASAAVAGGGQGEGAAA